MDLAAPVLCILLAQSPALTQERTIAISGTVFDPSGTPAPGTQATLLTAGGTSRTAVTDQSGVFRFEPLEPGSYVVEVAREGFVAVSVQVRAGNRSPAPLRIHLKLARVRQEITVQGEAAPLGVEAGENRDVVSLDRQLLDNLPLFDQDYVAAMSQFLDPGSVG